MKKQVLSPTHKFVLIVMLFLVALVAVSFALARAPGGGSPQCNDGLDNDGDNKVDYPGDPGCSSKRDASELNANVECDDGIDNDGDSARDYPTDSGCASLTDISERGSIHCDDGLDNDNDGKIDYPNDPGCTGIADTSEVDDSFPIATPSASPTSGTSPLNVSFTGSVSGGDAPLSYFWDFKDGSTSTLQHPTHVFNKVNDSTTIFNVLFRVVDTDGDDFNSNVLITVS